jgi:hypothetical protein
MPTSAMLTARVTWLKHCDASNELTVGGPLKPTGSDLQLLGGARHYPVIPLALGLGSVAPV